MVKLPESFEIGLFLYLLLAGLCFATYKLEKQIKNLKETHDKAVMELYDRITELEEQLNNK